MNRILLIAVSVAILFGLAISTQPLKAQVFDEFGITTLLRGTPYQELGPTDGKDVIPAASFRFPLLADPTSPRHRDDGFYTVALPFDYEFNGEVYNSIEICVNGYIMFLSPGEQLPSTVIPKNLEDPLNYHPGDFWFYNYFFYFNASYPKNLAAPFMGDHFYRTGDDNIVPPASGPYMNSEISIGETDLDDDGEIDVFTVQWKNLNINYDDPDDADRTAGITSSVGSFQVKLYRSTEEPYSYQGDIDFCYGQIGGNINSTDTRVITKNAVIGIKGNSGKDGEFADFLNGLYNVRSWEPDDLDDYVKEESKNVTTTTILWQPSGGSDYRVVFYAMGRRQKEQFWGDGDADLSQIEGNRHGNMSQPRFVTVSDARDIIRSIVTRMPLSKERRREAYHADVNHNGRYIMYYDAILDETFKKNLPWKNDYYGDSVGYIVHDVWVPDDPATPLVDESHFERDQVIPSGVSSLSQIFFEATEYDAAMILHYMGGRITQLPYIQTDSIPTHGKIIPNELFADGIGIGNVSFLGNNTYKVPVYLNGTLNGPLAVKARFNGNILSTTAFENVMTSYNNDILVIAGTDDFDEQSPVCFVTIRTDEDILNISEIRFNDRELPAINLQLTSIEEITDSELILQNVPNPFTDNTIITVNLLQDGNYNMKIYDSMGNIVKTYNNVVSGDIKWDGKDENGNTVGQGVYIYRLTGDNLSVSKKLVITR
ncbi:T9SS type A sorting domain-containing protein [Bacteroidota bacterium]